MSIPEVKEGRPIKFFLVMSPLWHDESLHFKRELVMVPCHLLLAFAISLVPAALLDRITHDGVSLEDTYTQNFLKV